MDDKTIEEMLRIPTPSCTFMGNFDETKDYRIGDIVFRDDSYYVFDGDKFQEVGNILDEPLYEKEITPDKCKSCGAPLIRYKSQIRCEYCGTTYR